MPVTVTRCCRNRAAAAKFIETDIETIEIETALIARKANLFQIDSAVLGQKLSD